MLTAVERKTKRKNPGGRPKQAVTKEENVHIRLESELVARLDRARDRLLKSRGVETSRAGFFRWLLHTHLTDVNL